tara:strand:+ start:1239 stop:1568 length:330 start_codon:yes stop_codon:yes gene_type:complete
MAQTFQVVIDDVRVTLNDSDGTRYTSEQLMVYCNDAIQEMYRIRPDLQFGNYNNDFVEYVVTDDIPIAQKLQHLINYYVVFRAELRDDEYADGTRAASMRSLFERELTK